MKEFYRASEVMVILNLGRTKVYELIRAGVIPSVEIDGNIRVPVKLLNEMIETIISASRRCESVTAQPPATARLSSP
jgi:excisionase family DNA binding protein